MDKLARLREELAAAQGAMIEAAAQIVKQVGKRAELDFPNDLGNHASRTCDHIEESIRTLQTEPMAAALAARDAKLIRNAATKLSVEEYECMERRIEAAQVAITQLQVVIESLKIADS